MRIAGTLITLLAVWTFVQGGGDGPKKEDIPKYIQQLTKSASAKERATAAQMIGKRGAIRRPDVEEGIEPLKIALQKDGAPEVRAAAAEALGNIAPDAKATVPLLIEALKDTSAEVKLAAITALGQYTIDAKAALPQLQPIAQNKEEKKLSNAAKAAVKSIQQKK